MAYNGDMKLDELGWNHSKWPYDNSYFQVYESFTVHVPCFAPNRGSARDWRAEPVSCIHILQQNWGAVVGATKSFQACGPSGLQWLA